MQSANLRSKLFPILGGLGLYLFTTGVSYAAFNYLKTPPEVEFTTPIPEGGEIKIDPSEPRTEVCPLNGKLYTKTERQLWGKNRPLTVMIENHTEARPQSGLSSSDIVYEAVAEGGITRFLAVFLCDVAAKDTIIGPIRSARTYYLDWASEYGTQPLYVHVGGANLSGPADALGQIEEYGWGGRNGNDLNQFSIGYPTFWRDYERLGRTVATEHTMYSSSQKLWAEANRRGWSNKDREGIDWQERFDTWKFSEENVDGKVTTKVSFGFWDKFTQYNVTWEYDQETKLYKRINGGNLHKDLNNDQQLTARVVIVKFVDEKGPIDELKHLLYKSIGSGKALIFQNGKGIEATWKKASRVGRTKYTNKSGQELNFAPGNIWIEIVPTGNSIDY